MVEDKYIEYINISIFINTNKTYIPFISLKFLENEHLLKIFIKTSFH